MATYVGTIYKIYAVAGSKVDVNFCPFTTLLGPNVINAVIILEFSHSTSPTHTPGDTHGMHERERERERERESRE